MEIADILGGLLIGVTGSLVAASLFPSFNELLTKVLVRSLGWIPFRRSITVSGTWTSTFYVRSSRYPTEVKDTNVEVKQFGNRVYAKFRAGNLYCYLVGSIDSGKYITGTWYDETNGGYHGAFQFFIDPATQDFSGKWVGYSTSGKIKEGNWVWVKNRELNQNQPNKANAADAKSRAAD